MAASAGVEYAYYGTCKEGHFHRVAMGYVDAVLDFTAVVQVPGTWFKKNIHVEYKTLAKPYYIVKTVRFDCPSLAFMDCSGCERNAAPTVFLDRSSLLTDTVRSFENRVGKLERRVKELDSARGREQHWRH